MIDRETKFILQVGFGFFILLFVFAMTRLWHAETKLQHVPSWTGQTCAAEDDVNCFNNRGPQPFIVRELPGAKHLVCVYFIDAKFAATHDYCA